MTTAAVAAMLAAFGLIDGAFSGFRSSLGRTGLLDHRAEDRHGAARGVILAAALLAPAVALVSADAALDPDVRLPVYRGAGLAMLAILAPYSAVMLTAIAAYAVLPWRMKFLSTSLVLGPLSLLRPPVAVAGAITATWVTADVRVALAATLAVAGVLAVEPLAGRALTSRARFRPGDG